MQRRAFLRTAAATAAGVSVPAWSHHALAQWAPKEATPDSSVRRALVVFKCHLDVGFTDTQANVMEKYFKIYFPLAMRIAAERREKGKDPFIWTTGSWLVYEYLEQASAAERAEMERAIGHGDIAWHALPFSWQTEMLDRTSIQGCLGFSKALDARFGRQTIAGKMTDVPGHTRSLIAPLAESGVTLLNVGVNPGSTAPEVPDAFLWKDPQGASMAVLYHRHEYGGVIRIPGSDLAVMVAMAGDNAGPHSSEQVDQMYAYLHRRFPNAKVSAATLTDFANSMKPSWSSLPVVTGEIGDTWIYGVPSDPPKIARYREMSRLRNEWLAGQRFAVGDATDRQLLRRLTLAVEHTWGTDTKTNIDHDHYSPKELAANIDKPGYRKMERSWQEKRDDVTEAVQTLPPALRSEALARLQTVAFRLPERSDSGAEAGKRMVRTKYVELALNAKTGAIERLVNLQTGKNWASPTNPLALFSYQTLSQDEYQRFLRNYLVVKDAWALQDFGKPNVERFGPVSKSWWTVLKQTEVDETPTHQRLLATLAIEDPEAEKRGLVAWPRQMYLEARVSKTEPATELTFYAQGKAANRMPEAMWLSFQPLTQAAPEWTLTKVNQPVSAMDVIRGGSRSMHAVSDTFSVSDGTHRLEITTLDAPVVALGEANPLNFSMEQPDLRKGAHVSLFNNAWGTNYPQWAGGDWMYRFSLRG